MERSHSKEILKNVITIKDLATFSGLSKSTVSRVINNAPNVKPETRERVLRAIEKLGYQPDILARGMVTGSLPMVLVIVGDIQNHYFTQSLAGLASRLEQSGFMVTVVDSGYEHEREVTSIHMARICHFAGIIPMTGFSSELVNLELKEADCPVVLLNCHRDNDLFDRIYGNDFRAGYQATQALIARGYRKVYHFSGNSASSVISSERERGYRQAMQEAGLPITHEMILSGDLRQEGGYQLAQICLNGQDPIAICCNNFLMCLGAMKYAQQQGMTIWKDYGMAICEQPPSFYGNSEFIYAGPNLQEIGKSAADLLLERIVHPGKPPESRLYPGLDIYVP